MKIKTVKFYRSSGESVALHLDGQIWISIKDGRKDSYSCVGYVVNHVCNVYKLLGIDKKYDDYIGVYDGILKYAKKFHIRTLRVLFNHVEKTHVGDRVVISYGYIDRDKFPKLLRSRKMAMMTGSNKAVMLKKSDMRMERK